MDILNRIKELQAEHNKTERCVICHTDTSIPVNMSNEATQHRFFGMGS
jgi:aminoglycoside phosphotransferase